MIEEISIRSEDGGLASILVLILSERGAAIMKERFDLEIEILQGKTEEMGDGRTRYILTVQGEKAEEVREFISSLLFKNAINPN